MSNEQESNLGCTQVYDMVLVYFCYAHSKVWNDMKLPSSLAVF